MNRKEIRTIAREIEAELHDAVSKKSSGEKIDSREFIAKRLNERRLDPVIRDAVAKEIEDDVFGYGPITDFINDESITEIMVNCATEIWIERGGVPILTDAAFDDEEHSLTMIRQRILEPRNKRLDESNPLEKSWLPDGSRIQAVHQSVAIKGHALNVRKFPKIAFVPNDLVDFGTLTTDMCDFLKACIEGRLNMIISGGTGSGKTSTLNVLSSFIPDNERIITIEDAAELQLENKHIISMVTHGASLEGKGEVSTLTLVITSLRMRPDRIIVGECRGAEAFPMMQAMNTGHPGSMTTVHTNSPRDTISRLERMIFMAGIQSPPKDVRWEIASAVDLIIHQERYRDGGRRISHITEITGMEGDKIAMQDIFLLHQRQTASGAEYFHSPTGITPERALEKIETRGIIVDREIFRPR